MTAFSSLIVAAMRLSATMRCSCPPSSFATRTLTYLIFGPTAIAALLGTVHGVVVHARSDVFSSSARGARTMMLGSCTSS